MLEIAILLALGAIFVILVFRFPKTGENFINRKVEAGDEVKIAEAKEILKVEDPFSPTFAEKTVDELDQYDKELAELLKSARDKIKNGKYISAENMLIDAVCKDSKCVWAYEQLGQIYLTIGKNYTDAEESFLMAVKLDKNCAPAWFGLGQIYFSGAKFNKAVDALQKAVNIDRSDASYQAMLGKTFMEVRQYGKAAKALKRASSLDISNQEYKNLASIAEDKHRDHSRASKLN